MLFSPLRKEWTAAAYFLLSLTFLVLSDEVIALLHKLFAKICERRGYALALLSESISIGNLKKIRGVCKLILFSATLFIGLQLLYVNVQNTGRAVAERNIHYSSVNYYNEAREEAELNSLLFSGSAFAGLKYKVSQNNSIWYIYGVDGTYFGRFESLVLDDSGAAASERELQRHFDDPDWNGVLLPATYAKASDVGQELRIKINGKEIPLKVAGVYYSNNFAHLNFYAGKGYLQAQLGAKGCYNCLYLTNAADMAKLPVKASVTQTKADLAFESYDQAVKGTSLVVMVAIVIILCAVFALINFIMLTSPNDRIDTARFRGLGISRGRLYRLYALESITSIVVSMLLAIPASIFMARGACCGMLAPYYFRDKFYIPFAWYLILFTVFALVSLSCRLISIRDAIQGDRYIRILRDLN